MYSVYVCCCGYNMRGQVADLTRIVRRNDWANLKKKKCKMDELLFCYQLLFRKPSTLAPLKRPYRTSKWIQWSNKVHSSVRFAVWYMQTF